MNSVASECSTAVERSTLLLLKGRLAEARAAAESALGHPEARAGALHVLGVIAVRESRFAAGAALLEQAIAAVAIGPESWWNNLGLAWASGGDWASAAAAFARGLEVWPESGVLHAGAARSLHHCGRFGEALRHWIPALESTGGNRRANVTGAARTLLELRRYETARELLLGWLEEEPECVEAHKLMVLVYRFTRQTHLARLHAETVLRLKPSDRETQAQYAAVCWDNGDLQQSLELCRGLIEAGVASPGLQSFYLSGLLHSHHESGGSIRAACERWVEKHCSSLRPYDSWSNDRTPERRLRIGYIGGEYMWTPSFHFLIQLFRCRDRSAFELVGYTVREQNDVATQEYRALSDEWRECHSMDVAEVAELVRRDGIDVLVDLTGHYREHRLGTMYLRPAPVNVMFPNYPGTTGIRMDGIFTDEWVCPPGTEDQYSEAPLRLPGGYLTYVPPAAMPEVTELPALRNGFVTFGLFQRPVKLSPAAWDCIARAVVSTPGSRLLIHNAFPELTVAGSRMRRIYEDELGARGVDLKRLVFHGPAPLAEHLRVMAEADIALDTFPYNGQTTTCECLWLGVPTVTLTGGHHVARVGEYLMRRAGYPEWVASSTEEYVSKAVALASDVARLAAVRREMRGRVAESPLLDARRNVREVEETYRSLWRQWCAGK